MHHGRQFQLVIWPSAQSSQHRSTKSDAYDPPQSWGDVLAKVHTSASGVAAAPVFRRGCFSSRASLATALERPKTFPFDHLRAHAAHCRRNRRMSFSSHDVDRDRGFSRVVLADGYTNALDTRLTQQRANIVLLHSGRLIDVLLSYGRRQARSIEDYPGTHSANHCWNRSLSGTVHVDLQRALTRRILAGSNDDGADHGITDQEEFIRQAYIVHALLLRC